MPWAGRTAPEAPGERSSRSRSRVSSRELMEQLLQARTLLVQLIQGPAAGLGEVEDLRSEVAAAVGAECDRHPAVGGGGGFGAPHAGQLAQRLHDARAARLDGDFDCALGAL